MNVALLSSKREDHRVLAALARGQYELRGERGLAGARRADQERARAPREPAAQQRVEVSDAAFDRPALGRAPMLGGDQSGKHLQSAVPDDEIMAALAKRAAAHLGDLQLPAHRTEFGVKRERLITPWALLWSCMSRTSPVLSSRSSSVVCCAREIALERHDLAPVAQWVLGQHPEFR